MTRLRDFSVLTFDCYGTLVDWESGICAAVAPWLERLGLKRTPNEVLEAFARHEAAQEKATPGSLYPDILANVVRHMAEDWGAEISDAEVRSFARSVGDWPAFADSAAALAYLEKHYRLVLLSNVDRESFARTSQMLDVEFYRVYTAEEIGSYKPDRRNFEYMIEGLRASGVDKSAILHTAQSIFHDHIPAKAIGLATNWIDRRHGKAGWGATAPPPEMPAIDFRHASMAEFAQRHRAER